MEGIVVQLSFTVNKSTAKPDQCKKKESFQSKKGEKGIISLCHKI